MEDGMGRTPGKGQRTSMVHAFTKDGPVVTEDADGFPIPEFFFSVGGKGTQAKQQAGELGSMPTAEFLWQAKHGSGDYHDALTEEMFMRWCSDRLAPAFQALVGEDRTVIPCSRQLLVPPRVRRGG